MFFVKTLDQAFHQKIFDELNKKRRFLIRLFYLLAVTFYTSYTLQIK